MVEWKKELEKLIEKDYQEGSVTLPVSERYCSNITIAMYIISHLRFKQIKSKKHMIEI